MENKHSGLQSSGLHALESFLPEGTLSLLQPVLEGFSVVIRIKGTRKSKYGDYRPLKGRKWEHQITLNNDLNPYSFLVTLLHEIAHMYAFEAYKGKVKPHGQEWRTCYSRLLHAFMEAEVFPSGLHLCLEAHLHSPT